jgi:hypothetical protein
MSNWDSPPSDRFCIVVKDRSGNVTDGTTVLREGADRAEMRREMIRLVHEIMTYPEDYHGGNVTVAFHFPAEES